MNSLKKKLATSAIAGVLVALVSACATQAPAPGTWAPNPPNPPAPYHAESRSSGEQGMVVLHVRTSPEGKPLEVQVKQSSGYARLDRSAVDTVKKWQFKPTPDDGTVVWREVPFRFSLTQPPPQPPGG